MVAPAFTSWRERKKLFIDPRNSKHFVCSSLKLRKLLAKRFLRDWNTISELTHGKHSLKGVWCLEVDTGEQSSLFTSPSELFFCPEFSQPLAEDDRQVRRFNSSKSTFLRHLSSFHLIQPQTNSQASTTGFILGWIKIYCFSPRTSQSSLPFNLIIRIIFVLWVLFARK